MCLTKGKTNWFFLLIIIVLSIIVGSGSLYYVQSAEKIYQSIRPIEIKKIGLNNQELKEKIGQMIMIGFRGTQATEDSSIVKIIKDVEVGGVSFSDWDVPSNSFPRNIIDPQQTEKLISDLQKYSDMPLLVGIDVEGGNVNRLKPKYRFESILSAERMGKDKSLRTVDVESKKIAEELKDLGFNMNFAPVVDLNVNPKNPIIGSLERSFSSSSEEVVNNARIFINNLEENNIISVVKHFPGQGSATTDTHLGITDVTDTYTKEELIPYQKLNEEGLISAVMTAHIIDRNIDDKPATLSKAFLQDILRKQIGFKGVIISDDIQMGAISIYSLEEAVISAINAGCDIVYAFNNIVEGYDENIAYKIRDIIFNAVKTGKISEKRIVESYNRILDLKKQFKIFLTEEEKTEIANQKFKLIGMPDAITFKEALDIANYVSSVVPIRPAFLMAVTQEELSLVNKYELCYVTDLKTGEGKTITDGKKMVKTMHPTRDMKDFLEITKALGKDPYKTPVTCPMNFGWGGAMGPADFIPSTWMRYKNKIEEITKKSADPWSITDAFLAAGLYLSESGAKLKTKDGEWKAAMIYFSGTPDSIYTWYADNTLKIAEEIKKKIDILEQPLEEELSGN
jgi:beta-N-acetylhexosaminidase